MGEVMGESMAKPFDLVLGRRTYEIFAAHWPYSEEPAAEPLNAATKHVASGTGVELGWANSQRIEDDVPAGVRALKAQDGPELQVHGSANLIQTLVAHDLIDECRVWIFPLVARQGKAAVRERHAARGTGAGRNWLAAPHRSTDARTAPATLLS
jgi:dihydrofolate reductase